MLRKTNREERLEMRTVNGRSQVMDATQIPGVLLVFFPHRSVKIFAQVKIKNLNR